MVSILRKRFSDVIIDDESLIPDLLSLQKDSYKNFLGSNDVEEQKKSGIYSVFKSIFPIYNKDRSLCIDFVSYEIKEDIYTERECLESDNTYSVSLKAKIRIITFDITSNKNKPAFKNMKESEIFLCDIPLMTENANFIYNGIERVIISQLKKSTGVFFDLVINDKTTQISKASIKNNRKKGSIDIGTKKTYTAKIIPEVGSWIELGVQMYNDKNEKANGKSIYLRFNNDNIINRFYFLEVLNILGFNDNKEILEYYYKDKYTLRFKDDKVLGSFNYEYLNKIAIFDIISPKTGEIVIKKDSKITKKIDEFLITDEMLKYFVLTEDYEILDTEIVDLNKKTSTLTYGEKLDKEKIEKLQAKKIYEVITINPASENIGDFLYEYVKNNTIDKNKMKEKRIRIENLLCPKNEKGEYDISTFNQSIYNLSKNGRIKLNQRLGLNIDDSIIALTKEDLLQIFYVLLKTLNNDEAVDDIDDLQNRKLFVVGDLIKERFGFGMQKIKRNILEKINDIEIDTLTPQSLINSKQLSSSINDFFAVSQLSQFMDSTNSLSELSHKRRITLFGNGGIKDKRSASIDVRDIHYSQYGKICPIETPEGPNIGLVNNLATFAKVDEYGFLQTPYIKVVNGVLQIKDKDKNGNLKVSQDDIIYLTTGEEKEKIFCNASTKFDLKTGKIDEEKLSAKVNERFELRAAEDINFFEVSQKQFVSITTNLVPFIANDDAKRSMMAASMMKQSVPFANPDFPIVGTGLEHKVALESGSVLKAKKDGVVRVVDSSKIIIETQVENGLPEIEIYDLYKFYRTNNNTSLNQRPIVRVGDKVKTGQILVDSQIVESGELAIGKNTLVAFLPWDGYNHEDSIIISKRLVQDDVFTSIHIERIEIEAKDTKNGSEKITRDIPNVSAEAIKKLDENGIISIGAEIKTGDILVGKVTPKSEEPQTPEEKLLKAIFGEKSNVVKDTSLYVNPNILSGKVIDVQIFTRDGLEDSKDDRTIFIENQKIEKIINQKKETINLLKTHLLAKISSIIENMTLEKGIDSLKKGDKLTKSNLKNLKSENILNIQVDNAGAMNEIKKFNEILNKKVKELDEKAEGEILKVKRENVVSNETLKKVKILIASKQKLQPGDKMSGRHGNKGVVSKIVPVTDMPYLEDGTPIDILLTPSGIPSRMNVGQILESHLGFASVQLGKQISKTLELIENKREKVNEIRKQLLDIFDLESEKQIIKSYSDDEVLEAAEVYKKGIPFAIPSFEKIDIKKIETIMEKAGIDKSGQVVLYDGRTGEAFDRPVTVGYMYMLKLHHLVDTKIHARSTGPYSLITQQPLGGKSHFGGQRFGEMEGWALQGYGAAYTLQEMLTVKSDDIIGRVKIFDNIVQGTQNFVCNIPESFKVTVNEIRALGLNMELIKKEDEVK